MKNDNSPSLACRHCQHYSHEGRRGGHCQRLGAPVKGEWKSCSLMVPCFALSRDSAPYLHSVATLARLESMSKIYTYQTDSLPLVKAS